MDWDKLKIFHAVAEAGSFTNATVNLNFAEAGVGSEYITITNATIANQIFQKASTNTNNGLTSLQLVIGDTYEIERLNEVKNSIDSSIALGRLIDSLSMAFKKNTPLEEAVPPEAREQAYGKNSLTCKSISDGFFSSLSNDSNIGKLIPFPCPTFDEDHKVVYELPYKFMIISTKEPKDLLNKTSLKLLKMIDVVFISSSSLRMPTSKVNLRFEDLVDLGDIIVRPDKVIYGIATGDISLQKLVDELLDHLIQ